MAFKPIVISAGSLKQLPTGHMLICGLGIEPEGTNSDLIVAPDGTGALIVLAGGDPRGDYAIEFNRLRFYDNDVASGEGATISGGKYNKNEADNGVIGGGYRNYISKDAGTCTDNTISGGADNRITQTGGAANNYSTVGGGKQNEVHSSMGVIGGGSNNFANNPWSVVGGGYENVNSSNYGFIGSGQDNDTTGNYAAIVCGDTNIITAGEFAFIGSGFDNTISAEGGFIGTGKYHDVQGIYGAIAGGYRNEIKKLGSGACGYNFIGGGSDNDIEQSGTSDLSYSVISGGTANKCTGTLSVIGGGGNNIASGDYSTVAGGYKNYATGSYSSVPGGREAQADKYGQLAYSAGNFLNVGDAQTSVLVARMNTTGNAATEMRLNGSTARLTIATDTAWAFKILAVATSDGAPCNAMWSMEGLVINDGGVIRYAGPGSTAPVQTLDYDAGSIDPTTWRIQPSGDDANNSMAITVTGQISVLIRWVARVELAEVAFP